MKDYQTNFRLARYFKGWDLGLNVLTDIWTVPKPYQIWDHPSRFILQKGRLRRPQHLPPQCRCLALWCSGALFSVLDCQFRRQLDDMLFYPASANLNNDRFQARKRHSGLAYMTARAGFWLAELRRDHVVADLWIWWTNFSHKGGSRSRDEDDTNLCQNYGQQVEGDLKRDEKPPVQ